MIDEKLKQLIEEGNNIFLTGQAGTGKSYQIDRIIESFLHKSIALTATTGLAAVNISGQTLHSFLNMGLIKSNNINQVVYGVINNRFARWDHVLDTDILIIDECSMLDGFMFEIIEQILKKVRKDNRPFGGMQVILVGDLFQLPPVQVKENGYFFESEAYRIGKFKPAILEKIYRQNDIDFITTLNKIRIAEHEPSDIEYLKRREFPDMNYATLDTTCLFSTNKEADLLNTWRLNNIQKDEITLTSDDTDYSIQKSLYKRDFSKYFRVPENLTLKEGCQVILLSNVDVANNICNGSVGTFEAYESEDYLYCTFNNKTVKIERKTFELYEKNKLIYSREQFPLRLGYGITIHASQGMSLDSVAIDLNKCFAAGMGYVALSRARTFERMYLKNIKKESFFIDEKVVNFVKSIKKSNT